MIHIVLSGDVQMVGFRQFVRYQARKLEIKGWVKNLPASRQGGPDGRVEMLLKGSDKNLEKMVEQVKKGPFLAKVKDVNIENLPDLEFESFEIIKE